MRIHDSHLMREDREADGEHAPVLFCWNCLNMTCGPCYDLGKMAADDPLVSECEAI